MKKILLLGVLTLSLCLLGCGGKNEGGIPKEEFPEESPVCPGGFYWFESVKQCIMTENAELSD